MAIFPSQPILSQGGARRVQRFPWSTLHTIVQTDSTEALQFLSNKIEEDHVNWDAASEEEQNRWFTCLLYTSPSPRDTERS
eukprot:10151557-Karenia_brevis.AAC.1